MIGRILIIPKGDYNSETTYEMLDLVFYNNESWLCKKESKGNQPVEGEYWYKFSNVEGILKKLKMSIVKSDTLMTARIVALVIGGVLTTATAPAPSGIDYDITIESISLVGSRSFENSEMEQFTVVKRSGSFYLSTEDATLMEECLNGFLDITYTVSGGV